MRISILQRPARLMVIGLLFAALRIGGAQAMDQQKHDDIGALLDLTGSLKIGQQIAGSIVPQLFTLLKKAHPDVPQATIDELTKSMTEEIEKSMPELREPMIAIYDANYSDDDIKQLLAFYRTPVGKKLVEKMPTVVQQSMAVGQVWGRALGERVARKFAEQAKQKGYSL